MFFTRKFKKLLSFLALLLWVHLDVYTAYAFARQSAAQLASIKLTPISLPASSAENPEFGNLFDRNTDTAYAPASPALIDVPFESPQTINEIRVYGPSTYTLTAQGQVNGQWEQIEPLEDIDLSELSQQWQRYSFTTALTVDALRLQLTPTAETGYGQGIREIEFWAPGQHEPVRSGKELLTLLDQGVAVTQGRQYQAAPTRGVIGPEADAYTDAAGDNTFRFDLVYRPEQIKRAYLSYELSGLDHWTSAIRSVNEQVAMGGYVIERGQGGRQIEEIAPAWLRQGSNQIRFVPVDTDSAYTVSNVQMLIELDDGANFVSKVSTNMGKDKTEAASLYDGDIDTGLAPVQQQDILVTGWSRQLWQPFSEAVALDSAAIELGFDRLTDLSSLGLYTTGKLKGRISVLLRRQGLWVESAASGDQHIQKEGWWYLSIPDGQEAQAVRLVFEGVTGKGRVSEVRVSGSHLGAGDEPTLNITYPDAGQYVGEKVYVRGFATPDKGADVSLISVGNQEVAVVNGEFEAVVNAEDANAEGFLEVTAAYPDGKNLVRLIPLLLDRLDEKSEIEIREYRNLTGDDEEDDEESETIDADQAYNRVNLIDDFFLSAGKEQKLHSDKTGAEIAASKGAVRQATKIRMMTLRNRDLPALDAGMVNVTGKAKGFRFLPHGMKFDKKVKVKLPYNKQLIPSGFKDEDIRTYFFDEAAGRWSVLERDSVDTATSGVVSETDHFTDMINAVVQVPESPQKVSFNPTQIKDIKVADPGTKVHLIEPPKANNQGDARLSYPLEVAPGRQGLQPQLAVQYSSGGGNGWMGLGWDLSTQAVSIDTRWGVPRYDADLETETYTLSGQQLTPLAHRTELVSRTAEKIFHARTEGAFQKIIRHGDHPAAYWWEVIDKNGTHFFYGGDPASELSDDAVLKDYSGNVGKWALRKVQDSNGNSMRYHYALQEDSGVGSGQGGVPGYELYLDRITYTGYGGAEGPYEVRFLRDRQLGEARRVDVGIDARLGFKKVIADLLRKVEVSYNGELIRSYAFGYRKGAFEKTLLERITQFDKDGKEFNSHQLEYFDEARNGDGAYKGFGQKENWDTGEDNVNAGLITEGDASAIGGNKTFGVGGHFYSGFCWYGGTKSQSVGTKVGFNYSGSKGLLVLTDVNGDGLPDKVHGSVFRPNLSGPSGGTVFGDPVPISLGGISKERSTMFSIGQEVYFGANVGMNLSYAETETSVYLSDVNGDGITDSVNDGKVRFGRADDPTKKRPVPKYGSDSSETPYPIGPGTVDTNGMLGNFEELYQEKLKVSPLHDTLRRWTAPYTGLISISGQVALLEDSSEERSEYATADGVRVAIQHNSNELWATLIEAEDYSSVSPESLESIQVHKGDRIYFRVQSRFDGAYDQVSWSPRIEYTDITAEMDENGFDPTAYDSNADFIPTGRSDISTNMPVTGTVILSGDVEKLSATSDDVRVVILRNDVEIFSQISNAEQAETIPVDLNLSISRDDRLEFKIEADSPIDLTQVHWKPHMEYTSAEGMDSVYDHNGNPVLVFDPPYVADVYGANDLNAPHKRWTVPLSGEIEVKASVTTRIHEGVLVLTVKRVNELVAKKELDVSKDNTIEFPLSVVLDDQLSFELSTRSGKLAQSISSYSITVRYTDPVMTSPDISSDPAEGSLAVAVPALGQAVLTGRVQKLLETAEDIRFNVSLNDTDIFSRTAEAESAGIIPVDLDVNMNRKDQVQWTVSAASPEDLEKIRWNHYLTYKSVEKEDSLYISEGNSGPVFEPPFMADVYGISDLPVTPGTNDPPSCTMWSADWEVRRSGEIDIEASVATTADKGGVELTVLRRNEDDLGRYLLKKESLDISEADSVNIPVSVAHNTLEASDEVRITLSSCSTELVDADSVYSVTVQYTDAAIAVPAALNYPAAEGFFGQPYRGWTYAGYKGDGEKAVQPVIETDLVMPELDMQQVENNKQTNNPEELTPILSPDKTEGIMFYPEPVQERWRGLDSETWVSGDMQSSSRLNENYISVPTAEKYVGTFTGGGAAAVAVNRLSNNTQRGLSSGAGVGPLSVSGSYTKGKSQVLLDFMDMNGDRFPDIISETSIQYSPMTGGLESKSRAILSGIQESETSAWNVGLGGNFSHNTSDIKSGMQMPALGVSGGYGQSEDWRNFAFMDINGDGLPDKVFETGKAALNLGYKFAAKEQWGSVSVGEGKSENGNLGGSVGYSSASYGFGGGLSISGSDHESDHGWSDINGDGLSDYVGKEGNVKLNTGGGFLSMSYPGFDNFSKNVSVTEGVGVYFTIAIPIPYTTFSIILNPGNDFSRGMSRPEVSIMDIDGDGFADHLNSEKDKKIVVRRNQIGRTNLLRKVNRPLGANFTLEYQRDGNTYQLPQSRWNLTRVEAFDGFVGDGVDTLVSTYTYEDGFHHRQEREFFGYKTVTTEQRNATDNTVYRSTVQTFLNRNYYEKGLLVSEIVQDGQGKKYLETLNSYQLRDVDSGQVLQGAFKDSLTATVFPEMIRTDKKFYEGQEQPGITTHQTFAYDALGNVKHFFDAADTGAADDVESFIQYHSDLANYIMGKAKKIIVKGDGAIMRQRDAFFETGTGNLKQVKIDLGSGTAVNDLGYDQYGNITSQTGPANKKGQRYNLTYTYDPAVHTYVTKIKDSFGYTSSAEHDLRWGDITRSTDLNNQSITYRHDSVGRVQGITGPYQQGKGRETIVFAYHPEATIPWALTQHFDNYQQQSDPLETVIFIDGLKRALQTKKDGAVSSGSSSKDKTKDVMIVSGRMIFDFAGRAVEQYYPVTENLGRQGVFNPAFDTVQPTRTSHDVMDRVLQTVIPDNTAISYAYGFGSDREGKIRFQTQVTDANQKSKVNYKDVRGLITSVKEFNKGETIWTSYQYDPMKQIIQVMDNQNNITTAQYDLGGRRTHLDSPDMGLTETVYDSASNAVEKITANLRATGKAIAYDYTYNRLDKILYPEYSGNNVTYTYGVPGATFNRADRIVTVTDASGSEERFYGPLGETVKTIKYVASATEGNAANSPEIYVTEYTYDTFNRLRQLIYPDNEVLTYSYNSGGLAQSASGKKGDYDYPYLKALTYDKFEQRVFMRQGNGAETDYTYNPLNRRLATLKGKSGGRTFMDLAYGYDLVGNILNLDNLAKVNKPNEFGGETRYTYKYDDLYRLTDSTGSLKQKPNTEHQYTLAMRYDDIHNIMSKNQRHIRITPGGSAVEQHKTSYDFSYGYGSSRPHAPTLIGDRVFSYDANGNQTGWESEKNGTRRAIVWDEENRIRTIRDNGHTLAYTYNDAGERVFKTGPQGETVYVNQFYTVGNREIGSKHVFVGTGRIVTKLVKGQENVTTPGSATHPGKSDPSGKANGHSTTGTNSGNNGGGSGGGSPGKGNTLYEPDMFYYHPNHLGSTSFVTDVDGELYQHLEYFPFGETWVEEVSNQHRVPYLFTAKELDRETGLYYFGARYYDPRTSVWQSCDPILNAYLEGEPQGGVFIPVNLGLYSYSIQNPIKYKDADGNFVNFLIGAAIGMAIDATVQGVLIATGVQDEFSYSSLAISAAAGATGVGLTSVLSKANKLGKVARVGLELAADATLSATEQAIRGEEVSLGSVVSDVALGQASGQIGQLGKKVADKAASNRKINNLVKSIGNYLGDDIVSKTNNAGDLILESAGGAKKVRFDINNPKPHKNSHMHVEEFKSVKNKMVPTYKSGPIYPKDVPHE